MEKYAVITLKEGVNRRLRMRLNKLLNGTTVSIHGRRYHARGLIEKMGGRRLCPGTYIVPVGKLGRLMEDLGRRGLTGYIEVKGICTCMSRLEVYGLGVKG